MSVVVAHPGRQHSHQLALALAGHGLLDQYWSGVPSSWPERPLVAARMLDRLIKHDRLDIEHARVACWPWSAVLNRSARWLFPASIQVDLGHRSMEWFDRWSARRLESGQYGRAVIAYENSALETFRVASRGGMLRVLDAASFHHAWQDRLYAFPESERAHERIRRRKDAEIALADHVLTASELARQSYLEAGVPEHRVTAIPVGCNLQMFHPPETLLAPSRGVRFLFAGRASGIKGIDLVIAALKELQNARIAYEFIVAGHRERRYADALASVGAQSLGQTTQQRLADEMREADCLLLPSRFDSFGMVVVEALASGLPVVVSSMVGAKQAVREGESGWIVPVGDVEALAERVRWCAENADILRAMRSRAREDALAYGWSAYRARVGALMTQMLDRRQEP